MALGGDQAFLGGFSASLVPVLSSARSWQIEDDQAVRLTELARGLESLGLESLLNQAPVNQGLGVGPGLGRPLGG